MILLLWSNIPTLAAGKRAFRQLRLVCAYRDSGILPGEEMVRANTTTSVISTNIIRAAIPYLRHSPRTRFESANAKPKQKEVNPGGDLFFVGGERFTEFESL